MISVILPIRNGDMQMIERAVSSVLKQSYQDFELLIIDDGSEEGFAKELDRLSAKDERIRLFHIEPSGVSVARNMAIREAKGDIITFIDGDDTITPYCFAEAAEILKDSDIDVLLGGTYYVEVSGEDVAGNNQVDEAPKKSTVVGSEGAVSASTGTAVAESAVNGSVDGSAEDGGVSGEELSKAVLRISKKRLHKTRAEVIGEPFRFENGGYINRGIAARFIRREVFDDDRFLFPKGIKMYEDAIWNLRMIESLRTAYVKRIWYFYYENPASASNKYNPDVIKDIEKPLRIMGRILDLDDRAEYAAYTRLLMDSLRYIFLCMYGNPAWKKEFSKAGSAGHKNEDSLSSSETYTAARRKVRRHLYRTPLWKEIKSRSFRKNAEKRDRQKALLYKMHLLFLYWKITWK